MTNLETAKLGGYYKEDINEVKRCNDRMIDVIIVMSLHNNTTAYLYTKFRGTIEKLMVKSKSKLMVKSKSSNIASERWRNGTRGKQCTFGEEVL